MHFYSGPPTHSFSGVDTRQRATIAHAPGASGRRRVRNCRGGAAAQSRRAGDGPISRHRARGCARKGGAPGRYALALPRCCRPCGLRERGAVAPQGCNRAASPDARRELIALIWLAQRPSLSFEAALRRTRRIPPAAQLGYLMGIRLERYIADGLRKLGCRGA